MTKAEGIPDLSDAFVVAGEEYLVALRGIGLEPEALFWAYDKIVEERVLVLVTSFIDSIGPLDVSSMLFKAYNASLTPKEIDPFLIALHSPKQRHIQFIIKTLSKYEIAPFDSDDKRIDNMAVDVGWMFPAYYVNTMGVYQLHGESVKRYDQARRWKKIIDEVNSRAA